MDIVITKRNKFFLSSADAYAMHRLRYIVFHDRLNWDVKTQNGLEFDDFDQLNPLYLLAKENGTLYGCLRLLPTTGANMLRDVFPELLSPHLDPYGEDTWELSRFAVRQQKLHSFGFSSLPLEMLAYAASFSRRMGKKRLITVTTLSMERLLKHAGLTPQRLGPVLKIGITNTVALSFELTDHAEITLLNAILRNHPLHSKAS